MGAGRNGVTCPESRGTAPAFSSSGLNAGAVPRDSGQVTPLRPAPIAVHDYGYVLGKLVGVKLREQTLFLNAGWFERVRYFHAINPANPIFWRAPRGARTPKRKEGGMRTFRYSGRLHDPVRTGQHKSRARARLQKLT